MKKILLLIVISVLVISSSVCYVQAAPAAILSITSNGVNLDGLLPDITVNASAKLSGFQQGEEYILILMLTKNNKIVSVDTAKKQIASDEEILSAELKMPEDVSSCKLIAMLWDSLDSMKPVSSAAILPKEKSGLKYISVNGELLEDFSESKYNYDKNIPIDFVSPEVSAPVFDGTENVSVKNSLRFPGYSEVLLKNPDGSSKKYKINYSYHGNVVDNISNISGDENNLKNSLKNGAFAYSDNEFKTLENIPSDLKNCEYIISNEDFSQELKEKWTGEDSDWYSFDVLRTSRIIILADDEISKLELPESGWERNNSITIDIADRQTGAYIPLTAYEKKAALEGAETVVIPNPSCDVGRYIVVIVPEYDGDTENLISEEDYITGLKYLGEVYNQSVGYYFDQPQYEKDFSDGVFIYSDNQELSADNVPEDLKGCDYIISGRKKSGNSIIAGSWGGKGINWQSFELKKSATVMIFPDGEGGDSLGYNNGGFSKEQVNKSTPYFSIKNNTYNTAHSVRYIKYSKHFEVEPGETVTVNIPNAAWYGNTKWAHIILIDYDD